MVERNSMALIRIDAHSLRRIERGATQSYTSTYVEEQAHEPVH